MSNGIDAIWCVDLVEMPPFSKWNKGYRYFLVVLNIFRKYGSILIQNKKIGETVAVSFRKLVSDTPRRPNRLWVDR